MSVLTAQRVIDQAKAKFNDQSSDHFQKDELSFQADGSLLRYQLTNRNIVNKTTGDPAVPADVVFIVNNSSVVPSSIDADGGIVVLSSAPAQGDEVFCEYFFQLVNSDTYLEFVRDAVSFINIEPTIPLTSAPQDTEVSPLYLAAMSFYVASRAADKMANLSSWWYQANAGNKSFNKDSIAAKFRDQSKTWEAEALKRRDDVSKRADRHFAPATGHGGFNSIVQQNQPRR